MVKTGQEHSHTLLWGTDMEYLEVEANTGAIKGWYSSLLYKTPPASCVPISKKDWQYALSINANCYKDSKFTVEDFTSQKEILETRIKAAKKLVSKELQWADIELNYTLDEDTRATLSEASIRSYRRECRDYVKTSNGGTLISDTALVRPTNTLKEVSKS